MLTTHEGDAPAMPTAQLLAELVEANGKRTPGEWKVCRPSELGRIGPADLLADAEAKRLVADFGARGDFDAEQNHSNATFTALCTRAMPAIVEAIEALNIVSEMSAGDPAIRLYRLSQQNERLRAELAAVKDEMLIERHNTAGANNAATYWKDNYDRSQAELAECKRDAERYRWIKKRCVSEVYGTGRRPLVRIQFDAYAATLDEAIDEAAAARGDAAIAQSGGTEKEGGK